MNEPKSLSEVSRFTSSSLARFYSIVLLGWAHWTLFELSAYCCDKRTIMVDCCVSPIPMTSAAILLNPIVHIWSDR